MAPKPRLYYTGNQLPPDRQVVAEFDQIAVTELPLYEEAPSLGFDGSYWLLPGGGAKPYAPDVSVSRRAGRRSLLCRAVGDAPLVLDAMAGWGTDALTLEAVGIEVCLVERAPLVWALLRARAPTARLGDGYTVISERRWPVIYLDPMFAPRGRKGLAKAPLQALQQVAAAEQRSVEDWLAHAQAHADDRVVLKTRAKAPVVGSPDWQLKGRSVRFDVYRPAVRRSETPSE